METKLSWILSSFFILGLISVHGTTPRESIIGDAASIIVNDQMSEISNYANNKKHSSSSVYLLEEESVHNLTNMERFSNGGVAPLSMNPMLVMAARKHSEDMRDRDYFDHYNLDGLPPWDRMRNEGYSYTTAGENIAWGQGTPEAVVTAWMNSPGHRANILNSNFRELGVGFAEPGPIWTQVFGTRREECGNGLVDSSEVCDDGNLSPDDGCAANCTIEPEYECIDSLLHPTSTCSLPESMTAAANTKFGPQLFSLYLIYVC